MQSLPNITHTQSTKMMATVAMKNQDITQINKLIFKGATPTRAIELTKILMATLKDMEKMFTSLREDIIQINFKMNRMGSFKIPNRNISKIIDIKKTKNILKTKFLMKKALMKVKD